MKAKKKKGPGVVPGDVYAGPLMDGRFGAVRVIKLVGGSAVLVTTTYIGATVPTIKDPALRKVLRQTRFSYENTRSVMITDRPPPPTFVHVGNFPVTAKERAIDPKGTFGSHWYVVQNVLMEWRWEHEREAFEREVAAQRAEAKQPQRPVGPRTRTPRSKLTEKGFWALIATLGDPPRDTAPLEKALAKQSQADRREFHELLAHQLYRLDGARYAKHAGAAGKSDDAFLYARCHVVARGRTFFKAVLADPARFPADVDFEPLLSVAPIDDDTHFSYETGSNAAGWPATSRSS